jgi:pyridoxal phosphate enzyme, YggS family
MDFANLQSNYNLLKERIEKACQRCNRKSEDVRLIVVTKTHPIEVAQAVLDLGIKDIGENRVQEIEQKRPLLQGDFSMHMIGHLQTNKAAKVLPLVDWILSIDSIRLVDKIDNMGTVKKIKALVEVNTSGESSKSGCAPEECLALCERVKASNVLEFRGLMTIGPLNGTETDVRKSFEKLRVLGEKCRHFSPHLELSMGMSSDFEWAIEEGSTMIRIGSLLLGNREVFTIKK